MLLHPLHTPLLSPLIRVFRAQYMREIPAHYLGNPYTREKIDVNVIYVANSTLVIPRSPATSFQNFYKSLQRANPTLFQRILSPSGTAKVASGNHMTPIKEITAMNLAGLTLPGDAQLYGWDALEREVSQVGLTPQLFFQGNGLYFNRGSAIYDGENLLAYPDLFLADLLESGMTAQEVERIAVSQESLKRPLLFFLSKASGEMVAYLHQFLPAETYRQGLLRLQAMFQRQGVRSALAASPPLVIPGEDDQPVYLPLQEVLGSYHANDVRHSLYCPYEGAVLLSAELGRAQCLQPKRLAAAVSAMSAEPVTVQLSETLHFIDEANLEAVLNKKGYRGRFAFDSKGKEIGISIYPLEGIYSHLVPFLTRRGVLGLVQTSGTRGNITGNDGPTLRQLSAILQDLNRQPPFDHDPIIAAASGSQGNDVPNLICRSQTGKPGLLVELVPAAVLDESAHPRGMVTTPRVAIALIQGGIAPAPS